VPAFGNVLKRVYAHKNIIEK